MIAPCPRSASLIDTLPFFLMTGELESLSYYVECSSAQTNAPPEQNVFMQSQQDASIVQSRELGSAPADVRPPSPKHSLRPWHNHSKRGCVQKAPLASFPGPDEHPTHTVDRSTRTDSSVSARATQADQSITNPPFTVAGATPSGVRQTAGSRKGLASVPRRRRERTPPQDRAASPPRKFACEICQKTFARRTVRDNHQRTHSDERSFTCSYTGCGEMFKQKNEQTRHEKSQHTLKEFVCGSELPSGKRWGCGRAFARNDGLLEHHTKTEKGKACFQESIRE